MSDQHDRQQIAYLNRVSSDLSKSLKRCHLLVDDYRAHLKPANSNDAQFMLKPESERDG